VNAAVKLDGQAMFEAVELDHPVLDAALAAKLRAQPPVPHQVPSRFLSFGLIMSHLADALGWDPHAQSITAGRTSANT
jgi:hypothetical protein